MRMNLRQSKVAAHIKETLGGLFQGGLLADPRLNELVVTYVKISPDLQVATVYFRSFGKIDKIENVYSGLVSASGFFRSQIAKSIGLRRVPNLRFFYDETADKALRLDEILSQL